MTTVRRWLPLLWLGVAALVIGLLMLIPAARTQLALSFTRQPTQFTELYFATDGALAERASGGLTVRFVVHARDTTRTTHRIRITVLDGAQTRESVEMVVLEPGELRPVSLTVQRVSDRWSTISVDLVGTADHIQWKRTPGEQRVLS